VHAGRETADRDRNDHQRQFGEPRMEGGGVRARPAADGLTEGRPLLANDGSDLRVVAGSLGLQLQAQQVPIGGQTAVGLSKSLRLPFGSRGPDRVRGRPKRRPTALKGIVHDRQEQRPLGAQEAETGYGDVTATILEGGPGAEPPGAQCDQRPRVAAPSRPRSRARSTASVRLCAPSLSQMWRMWVFTVLVERKTSAAISGAVRFVGTYRRTRISASVGGSAGARGSSARRGTDAPQARRGSRRGVA
jgi:hypothetical protein